MSKLQKALFLWFGFALTPLLSAAQESDLRNFFESNQKIYVVILVLATILIGLFAVLFYLERRIRRLEKEKQLEGESRA